MQVMHQEGVSNRELSESVLLKSYRRLRSWLTVVDGCGCVSIMVFNARKRITLRHKL